MELNELQRRTARLNPKLSTDAVALLQLAIKLSSEGKIKNSVMQNEIPNLLKNVEQSEELQRKIEKRKFFLQFGKLINSVSATKLALPDDTYSNSQRKSEVDKKIELLITLINKLLREDGPLETDFKYQITSDGVKILSYAGINFDVLKIPETIEGRPINSIDGRAFQGNVMRVIQFPNTLLELGDGAFKNCQNLESVTLPPRLTRIPDNCFANCVSLREINFNDVLKQIGKAAFQNTAVEKIILPKSVRLIDDNAFRVSAPLKALFEVESENLNVSEAAFPSTSKLYYRNSKIENVLNKTHAKVSGNVAEFVGDSTGSIIYKICHALKNVLIFGFGLIALAVMGLFSFIRTPVGLGVASVAAIYFAYDKFFEEKDELIGEVGSVAVQLNDQRGVDQTVIAYNAMIQKLHDSYLNENPNKVAVINNLFIKSCALEESDEISAYYYATLNNDDYICFQANADGYISAAYVWINENHSDIIMTVLTVTLYSVVNVDLDEEFSRKIFDKLAANGGNVMFHSLQAKRDFKVSSAKKGDKYQYIIKAFTE